MVVICKNSTIYCFEKSIEGFGSIRVYSDFLQIISEMNQIGFNKSRSLVMFETTKFTSSDLEMKLLTGQPIVHEDDGRSFILSILFFF